MSRLLQHRPDDSRRVHHQTGGHPLEDFELSSDVDALITGRDRTARYLSAPRLPRDLLERRFQVACSVTADPVQMHQQAGRILAFRTVRLDTGSFANIIEHV